MLGPIAAMALAVPSPACAAQPVFSENFAAGTAAQWTTAVHGVIPGGNHELQAYRANAVTTDRRGLLISAARRSGGYVSGRIASKASFRYGCFDIVAQMPEGRGLWPALWLRTAYDLPIAGEIDIMEGFGSHPGLFQSTLHQWDAGMHRGFQCARIGDLRASAFALGSACRWQPRLWPGDFTAAPHRYGLIWTPTMVRWLIDGEVFYTLRSGVPQQPMQIQLNLAVGGVFDGNPDAQTPFPAQMIVQSVRVWPLRR